MIKKYKLLILVVIMFLSALLTRLWLTNILPYPVIPEELSMWLSSLSSLPKGDLSILVGFSFFFTLLSLITLVAVMVLTRCSRGWKKRAA